MTLTPHAFKHCALVMLVHCCCTAAMRALAMPMPHAPRIGNVSCEHVVGVAFGINIT